jgi:DNA mismatch endonuclease (patch repair protein)
VHIRPVPTIRRAADIVFTRTKVAVFVDGCFWHGCALHRAPSRTNSDWWRTKIEGNVKRDRDTTARLEEAGWIVIRIWEHDDSEEAAARVADLVRSRMQI